MKVESEVDAIKVVDEALGALQDEDARVRVLSWATAKYLKEPIVNEPLVVNPPKTPKKKKAAKTKKSPKKAKSTLKMVKDLNLNPSSKKSAVDFAAEKQPGNVKQKCVVAIHYLHNILGLEKAGIDHIYTFFKGVKWPAPADFANTLHQAGSAGWLDTADAADIKITPIGDNVVEHELPKKKKK